MGKRQAKKTGGLSWLFWGAAISLGIYLAGVFVLAWLVVVDAFPPANTSMALAVWAMVSTVCGSLVAGRAKQIKPLLTGCLHGCLFDIAIIAAGYLIWEGPSWTGNAWGILACGLIGGVLPVAFGGGGGKRRKRKYAW